MVTIVFATISDSLIKNRHFTERERTMEFADNTTGTLSLMGHINALLLWNVQFTVTYRNS